MPRIAALSPQRHTRKSCRALQRTGQYCFTLNGFPYGGFHAPSVKAGVFQPTWADTARCDYTIDLATILAELLPDVSVGSISTLGGRCHSS